MQKRMKKGAALMRAVETNAYVQSSQDERKGVENWRRNFHGAASWSPCAQTSRGRRDSRQGTASLQTVGAQLKTTHGVARAIS